MIMASPVIRTVRVTDPEVDGLVLISGEPAGRKPNRPVCWLSCRSCPADVGGLRAPVVGS